MPRQEPTLTVALVARHIHAQRAVSSHLHEAVCQGAVTYADVATFFKVNVCDVRGSDDFVLDPHNDVIYCPCCYETQKS